MPDDERPATVPPLSSLALIARRDTGSVRGYSSRPLVPFLDGAEVALLANLLWYGMRF